MSAPPGRMGTGRPEDQGPNLAWSALFVVASLLGGLAAADIAHVSAVVTVLVSLLVAVVMVILLYMGLLGQTRAGSPGGLGDVPVGHRAGSPAGGQHRHGAEMPPGLPGQSVHSQPRQAGAGPQTEPGVPARPVARLVQPPPGGQSDGEAWWQGHVADRAPERTGSQPAPRAVSLSHFIDRAQIAQCPRCGAFRIDVDDRASEWLFECRECRQRWTWQPGTPWPDIQVRPEARGRPNRPRA
jgi:hypothetical protein